MLQTCRALPEHRTRLSVTAGNLLDKHGRAFAVWPSVRVCAVGEVWNGCEVCGGCGSMK